MKRIIIISSFAATALFTLTGGVQAQNSIEQVLKNIETNNKELQANAQLITSQKLESKTDNNLPDPTLSYAHLWGAKDKNETIGELVVPHSMTRVIVTDNTRGHSSEIDEGFFGRQIQDRSVIDRFWHMRMEGLGEAEEASLLACLLYTSPSPRD